MKRARYYAGAIGILAAAAIAAKVILNDHQNVYSLHIYSAGTIYGRQWLIGTSPNFYGLTEYTERQDADGRVVFIGNLPDRAVKFPTFTGIHLGSRQIKVRAPFVLVASALIILALGIISVAIAAVRWVCESDGGKETTGRS